MKKKPDSSDAELLTKEEFKKNYPNMDYLVYLNTNGRWIVLDSPHNHLTYVSKLGHKIKVGEPEIRYIGGTDPYMYKMSDEDFAQFEKSSIKWATKESQNKLEFQDMVQQTLKYYENVKLFPTPITLTDLLERFGDRLSEEEKEKLKSICKNKQ